MRANSYSNPPLRPACMARSTRLTRVLYVTASREGTNPFLIFAKTLKSDPRVNPYSCDPVILEQMKVSRVDRPRCAVVVDTDAESTIMSSQGTDGAIGNNLLFIQNAANATDQGGLQ